MSDDSNSIILGLSVILLICWIAFLGLTIFNKDGNLSIKIGGMELNLSSSETKEDDSSFNITSNDKEDDLDISRLRNNNLKIIEAAKEAYSDLSMSTGSIYTYFNSSSSSTHSGMCFTMHGLTDYGYYVKDNSYTSDALVLVEVPYNGEAVKVTSWYYEGNYGINGLEEAEIKKVSKFDIRYNDQITTASYSYGSENIDATTPSGGPIGVVSELSGIKSIINDAKIPNRATIKSNKNHGGTGEIYMKANCITNKIYQ